MVFGCNLKSDRIIFVPFQSKPLNITESKFMSQPLIPKKIKLMVLRRPTRPFRTNAEKKKKKDVLLIIGGWNANKGSQEIPGVTGMVGLGI